LPGLGFLNEIPGIFKKVILVDNFFSLFAKMVYNESELNSVMLRKILLQFSDCNTTGATSVNFAKAELSSQGCSFGF